MNNNLTLVSYFSVFCLDAFSSKNEYASAICFSFNFFAFKISVTSAMDKSSHASLLDRCEYDFGSSEEELLHLIEDKS